MRSAPYTEKQLTTAVDTVARSAAARQMGVVTVKPRPDASGIVVGVNTRSFSAKTVTATLPSTGVATSVDTDASPKPIATRDTDISPFFGGAVVINPTFLELCTSGWPVHFTANAAAQFLLTANHCGSADGGDEYFTPQETLVGRQISTNDIAHDTLMIELDASGSTGGVAIYTGGVDGNGQYNGVGQPDSPIAGSGTPEVGDFVCASGALSGERCLTEIANTDVEPPNTLRVHMVEATVPDGSDGIAGPGDSGGPVYTPNVDGSVTALGTLSSINPMATAPCTGVQDRVCARQVYFSNINDAISFYGISVNVGD